MEKILGKIKNLKFPKEITRIATHALQQEARHRFSRLEENHLPYPTTP